MQVSRRSFFGLLAAALVAPSLPNPAVAPVTLPWEHQKIINDLERSLLPAQAPGAITVDAMYDAFAAIQRQSFMPEYIFMHPLEYKRFNPEGYAAMVLKQENECLTS